MLAHRRRENLLGRDILGVPGSDFDIEIHVGAGAYVCGEESALIESLEGKRGTPRNRPPFPVTNGYLDQPTIVNNVETFAAAALIALNGGDWYAGIGTKHSTGTKILSVSGDCERPGIYEYPFGVSSAPRCWPTAAPATRRRCRSAGRRASASRADEFGRRIAFEDIPTAGAFMVFDQRRDMFEVARNFVHFFAHESCGFCTPCRVGTSLLRNMMDKLHNGHGSPYDFEEIRKLNRLLQSLSHCGLGHTACNPVLDTIAKFRPAYDRRMEHDSFEPAFDLDRALAAARQMTGRDDPGAHIAEFREGDMNRTFTLDGRTIPFTEGQTIIQAATAAGVFIPHLCYHPDFKPHGSCKLCTVKVNGRQTASCTHARRGGHGGRERYRRNSTTSAGR